MLRHSLYKKFGKKYQIGGQKDPAAAFKAPAPFGTFTTPNQPQGTISTQDASFAPGVFSNEKADNTYTPFASPLNIFDVNLKTSEPEQGPLTQSDMSERGITVEPMTPAEPEKKKNPSQWQDYVTLGLAGVSGGLNRMDTQRRDRDLQQSIQQRDTKPLYDYNWMYGRTTSGGTEYQPTIMAQQGANIRRPLNSLEASNVEIEGGEFLILPDGTTEIAKGPSHAKGGIDTILPEGTKVFSNHLRPMDLHKMPAEYKQMLLGGYMEAGGEVGDLGLDYLQDMIGSGTKPRGKDSKKTFAEIAKKYDLAMYKKVLDNPFASAADKQTASLMMKRNAEILDQLFRDQQMLNGNSSGEPMEGMKNGGINNPGFKSLPGHVQAKIMSNMQSGGRYKIPQGATVVSEADVAKANAGDYVRFADGTVKKLSKKDVKVIDKGFNKDFSVMKERWNDPKLDPVKDQMWSRYVKENPNAKMSKEQYLDNYINTQEQLYAIDAAAAKDPSIDLSNPDWDKTAGGNKNKRYKELVKKLGLPELNEEQISQFQQGYKDIAAIQTDPQYKEALADFDLAPKGVGDQQYLGKAISPSDAILGNTTVRQLQYLKNKEEVPTYEYENVPEETPPGNTYNPPQPGTKGEYEPMAFPLSQAIPAAYGLAQAQETFPYAIPEVEAPYIRPQTLNIQSQLQDADNNAIAAMRYGADPNLAYIAGLDSKQKAFETKQNYDAEGRSRADLYNADAKFKADSINAGAFNQVYNDLYAGAKSAQSEQKAKAINSLSTNRSKWAQDENLKKFYYNNFVTNYDFDSNDPNLEMNAKGSQQFNIPGVNTSSATTTTTQPSSAASSTQPNIPSGPMPAPGSPGTSPGWPSGQAAQANPSTQPTQPQGAMPGASPMVRTNPNSNLPLSMQYGENNPALPEVDSFMPKSNLNPNLPLSMQYGMEMGGQLDYYLNPFKKKKGFRKK
jgi:hypothetical protein